MRYHFIPLGLVLLLPACAQDPTGPTIAQGPKVDAGRDFPEAIPINDPGLCLKQNIQLSSRVDQGGFELLPHPPCPKVQ